MTGQEQGDSKAAANRRHWSVRLIAVLVLLASLALFALLALTGRPLTAPGWVVSEVESRVNAALEGQARVTLGAAEVIVDKAWVPRVRLRDVTLISSHDEKLATVPELRIAFAPQPILRGKLRPRSLRLRGGHLNVTRARDGSVNLALNASALQPGRTRSLGEILDRIDEVMATPALSELARVDAEALTLSFDDARAGRLWQVRDGRLSATRGAEEMSTSLAFDLAGAGEAPAKAELSFVSNRKTSAAQLGVTLSNVPARELALQAPALTWLSVLDAPISGSFRMGIDAGGALGTLDGTIAIGAGAVRPVATAPAVPLKGGKVYISYQPGAEKVNFSDITLESAALRLRAAGSAYLRDMQSGLPRTLLAQFRISELTVDPDGVFETPARFTQGAMDLRLRLDPFALDIGQVALVDRDGTLRAHGRVVPVAAAGDGAAGGWQVGLDFGLDTMSRDSFMALWPVGLAPKTRRWAVENIQTGQLRNVNGAVRLAPGAEPRLSLGYEFADTDVRFIRTLPPIRRASGFSSIEGKVYTVTVESGRVTAPQGGSVDATGTVFRVPDITKRPADGEITLQAAGPITAALSLLDQKPFAFLAKAGRPVDLAEGHARITAEIRTPLRRKVPLSEVDYEVEGTLSDLRSDKLAPGRVLTARELTVSANRAGLTIAGEGFLGTLPFNASWRQDFGPEHRGKSRVEATVSLDHTFLDELKIALPRGAVSGAARARVTLDMTRGEPTRYFLGSDLAGATLAIPELGWSKTAGGAGKLEISGTLGKPATVEALRLAAAGLEVEGDLTLRDGGGLDRLRLSKVKVGGWLDGTVEAMGQGAGKPMAISVTSGTIDLRRRTPGAGGNGAGALDLALDRLVVSDAIALTGFRGRFSTGGGLSGKFTARVNGEVPVEGAVSPENGRSAVRILSEDAGAVFAAAGVYPNGRGGAMDLVLRPRAEAGEFDGTLAVTGARVRNTPVLAELLNLISVVGALDQLQNSGLYFSTVDARFRLTPAAVEITQASAVGPSMGISMAGLYRLSDKALDIQGVISPVYIVNGIGQIFARRGEGLFGFNYRVAGPAAAPKVSVNPLSFLTPGMFREIFRRPPPKLAQ